MQTLLKNELYAKLSKCEFWFESVAFLGHVVSHEGIKVDPQKIEVVKSWPRPTTLIEIRSFLGLESYYRRFVEGFSTLASPLSKLTQKATKFQWSDACEKSFQELKAGLTTVPLKIHEKNYPTHDLELTIHIQAEGIKLEAKEMTVGQAERTIQMLEDMLRACVLDFGGN
ncbi:uncharacterized mitochondrial protein AtMg00860-like [Nicotiana tomentosiformis]|uniref:uncharacterized mitochondrial protein AtMg00860-like n=1 Tax=Nicotiana tomentosiformis TaxID=4098 RepID=UPI00388CBF2B